MNEGESGRGGLKPRRLIDVYFMWERMGEDGNGN
jgi:hypothetical protein